MAFEATQLEPEPHQPGGGNPPGEAEEEEVVHETQGQDVQVPLTTHEEGIEEVYTPATKPRAKRRTKSPPKQRTTRQPKKSRMDDSFVEPPTVDDLEREEDAEGYPGVVYALYQCGLHKQHEMNGIISHTGVRSMYLLTILTKDNIEAACKSLESLPQDAGKCWIGQIQRNLILGLIRWAKIRYNTGKSLRADSFTRHDAMRMWDEILSEEIGTSDNTKVDMPTKFNPQKWPKEKERIVNFLSGQPARLDGASSLRYLTRKDLSQDEIDELSGIERREYLLQFKGRKFTQDNAMMYRHLKALFINTDHYAWIKEFDSTQDGRKAWLSICRHFDSDSAADRRLKQCEDVLKHLEYRNEVGNCPWEKFVTTLKDCFETLAEFEGEKTDKQKVKMMCERISHKAHRQVLTQCEIVLTNDDTKNDFEKAADSIGNRVVPRYAYDRQRISSVQRGRGDGRGGRGRGRGGRHGRGNGRGRDRGGRGRGNRDRDNNYGRNNRTSEWNLQTTVVDGVNVSDPNTNFTDEQYHTLYTAGYLPILRQRRSRNASSVDTRNIENRITDRIVAAIHQAQQHSTNNTSNQQNAPTAQPPLLLPPPPAVPEGQPTNGNQFGSHAYQQQQSRRGN